jgi:hypothetical protein
MLYRKFVPVGIWGSGWCRAGLYSCAGSIPASPPFSFTFAFSLTAIKGGDPHRAGHPHIFFYTEDLNLLRLNST